MRPYIAKELSQLDSSRDTDSPMKGMASIQSDNVPGFSEYLIKRGSIWRTKAEYVYTLERVRPGEYEAALQGKWKPEKKQ